MIHFKKRLKRKEIILHPIVEERIAVTIYAVATGESL